MKRTSKSPGKALMSDTLPVAPGATAPEPQPLEERSSRDLHWEDDPAHYVAEETEEAEELPMDETAAAEGLEGEDSHAPDDALGLYLRQMGAIPLLSREQELELAKRLEEKRRKYRHATMTNWRTLAAVVDTFERVLAEDIPLDPTIDVVATLKLSRDVIQKRMPYNIATLRQLLTAADEDFRTYLRASGKEQHRLRREMWLRLRKAVVLAEELSPRIDLLDHWTDELCDLDRQMTELARESTSYDRSAADRERRTNRPNSSAICSWKHARPRKTWPAWPRCWSGAGSSIRRRDASWPRAIFAWLSRSPNAIAAGACPSPT